MARMPRGREMSERQARDEATRREAMRLRVASLQVPWSGDQCFTERHEVIAVGWTTATVHTAERLGLLDRDYTANVWRRRYGSPELEHDAMQRANG